MNVDYLIVGQGISGSVLALTLEQQGKSVAIINQSALSSSSMIAAGVYNPFNFRRSIPTWRAKEAIEAVHVFYPDAEQKTGANFHFPKNILRIFETEQERNEWQMYIAQSEHLFAKNITDEAGHIHSPFGFGILEGGGMIDTGKFVDAVRTLYNNRGYYIAEEFDFSLVKQLDDSGFSYGNRVQAKRIVFCEGHLARNNPFFHPKVIAPTKGELLHVKIPGLNSSEIINGPVYLVPAGDDTYICGATFNPGKSDEEVSAAGKDELLAKLRTFIQLPCTVLKQFAGVRPAGRDRKPVLGRSKKNRNIAIFNGMGSKAVMLAPYLAQVLVNHLENDQEIPAEISISRFKDSI